MKTKRFYEPVLRIIFFEKRCVLMDSGIEDSSSDGTTRTPVNPISDGGNFNW